MSSHPAFISIFRSSSNLIAPFSQAESISVNSKLGFPLVKTDLHFLSAIPRLLDKGRKDLSFDNPLDKPLWTMYVECCLVISQESTSAEVRMRVTCSGKYGNEVGINGVISMFDKLQTRERISMPTCPMCGREVDASDAFCRYCGAGLTQMEAIPTTPEGAVKAVLIQRLDGIKRKNAETILGLVDKEKYTKFDDWAPFQRQNSEALRREAEAFQVLKEYNYETSDWRIDIFDDAAVASFMIAYRGTIRNSRFNIRSRVSAFLLNKDGKWKLIHEHWSRLPEERRRLFPF